jgi:hypothetical protein
VVVNGVAKKTMGVSHAFFNRPHFDQANCLEKSIGEPPSFSLVELGVAPHKVETDRDA